jgi:BlaI family penicillinase repressor
MAKEKKLGEVQLAIMRVLWERGRATAKEVTEALNEQRPVAHSTVQTLLRKLEKRGSVTHEKEGRTFYFIPLVQEDEVQQTGVRELLNKVFQGSASGLVSHLLKEEKLSDKELAEIKSLIEDHEEKRK